MKRKVLIPILIATAAVTAAFALLMHRFPGSFSSLFAFPFEQIAAGLAALAGTGAVGNGVSLMLLIGISMIPVLFCFRYGPARESLPEKITLAVLSAALLFSLIGMMRPGLFLPMIPDGAAEYRRTIRSFFGMTVWSVTILFIVLRLIRLFRSGGREKLMRYLGILLCVMCVFFTAGAVFTVANGIPALIDEAAGTADTIVGAVRIAAAAIPFVFDLAVILHMLTLLDASGSDDREKTMTAAKKLSRISCLALAVTAGLSALQYLVQMILMPNLSHVSASLDIPIIGITFVVIILLLSRLIIENRQLREDNSLFI